VFDMEKKPNVMEISEKAKAVAEALFLKKAEGIASVAKESDGWKVEVEVLERKSIPDTRDILSRFEIKFDPDGEVTSYRRLSLRHRGDMEQVEEEV